MRDDIKKFLEHVGKLQYVNINRLHRREPYIVLTEINNNESFVTLRVKTDEYKGF